VDETRLDRLGGMSPEPAEPELDRRQGLADLVQLPLPFLDLVEGGVRADGWQRLTDVGTVNEWIAASAVASWMGSDLRAYSNFGFRRMRGATDVPSTKSMSMPAVPRRPPAGS